MSDQLFFMIAIDAAALAVIAFAFTAYEFRRHVVEDPELKDQEFHGEKVEHRLLAANQ